MNSIVLGPSPGELLAAWLEVFLYEMIHCTLIHVVVCIAVLGLYLVPVEGGSSAGLLTS